MCPTTAVVGHQVTNTLTHTCTQACMEIYGRAHMHSTDIQVGTEYVILMIIAVLLVV